MTRTGSDSEAVQAGAGSRFAERGHLSSKEWPGMLRSTGTFASGAGWRPPRCQLGPCRHAEAGRLAEPNGTPHPGAAAELIALRGLLAHSSTRDIAAAVGGGAAGHLQTLRPNAISLVALVRLAVEWPLELSSVTSPLMPVPAVSSRTAG